jgi:hypothetical protein
MFAVPEHLLRGGTVHPGRSIPSNRKRSLLQMLGDGTAGAPTRLLVSLAAGALLAGGACILSYVVGYLYPRYGIPAGYGGGRTLAVAFVSDQAAAVSFLLAGLVYVATLHWIWSRHRHLRVIWVGASLTLGIVILAILACVVIDVWFAGDDEFLIAGVLLGAAGAAIALWTRLYHRHVGGRALYDENGTMALRCPACQYSMVGLKESRCPECGQEYTLDELLARQDFEVLRLRSAVMGPHPQATDAQK